MIMKTLTQRTSAKEKRQGRYRSVEDAIQQKQAALLKILAGVDLSRFTGIDDNSINFANSQSQPANDNVADVPYKKWNKSKKIDSPAEET